MPDTTAGILTIDNEYDKLCDALRTCQDCCANLAHLFHATYDDPRRAEQFIHQSELFKIMIPKVRQIRTGRAQ